MKEVNKSLKSPILTEFKTLGMRDVFGKHGHDDKNWISNQLRKGNKQKVCLIYIHLVMWVQKTPGGKCPGNTQKGFT